MPADLIVYALVAAGLVFWLRNILGTRNGEEKPVESPLLRENRQATPAPEINGEDLINQLAARKDGKASIEGAAAQNGLIEISKFDRAFDINFFVDGAQEAFAIVVESFAAGDRATLKDLLSENVYRPFEEAIGAREQRGDKQATQIRAIRKAEVIEARLSGRTAFITMRFTADEVSVTRNAGGEIIDGHPDKATQMRDVWVFSRDLRSRDPRWLVVETRGDFEDDNKILPNTVH